MIWFYSECLDEIEFGKNNTKSFILSVKIPGTQNTSAHRTWKWQKSEDRLWVGKEGACNDGEEMEQATSFSYSVFLLCFLRKLFSSTLTLHCTISTCLLAEYAYTGIVHIGIFATCCTFNVVVYSHGVWALVAMVISTTVEDLKDQTRNRF